jgi:predicted component of viral defense system (DUF524 family)
MFGFYFVKLRFDKDINEAKESIHNAKNEIKQAENDANDKVNSAYIDSENRINEAYKEAYKKVSFDLSEKLKSIENREKYITNLEKVAAEKTIYADKVEAYYKQQNSNMKSEFERKEQLFTKSRENAVAAMQRRKNKR